MRLMCISRHGGMCLAAVLLLSWTASLLGNWYMQGKVYAVEAGRTPQTLADLLAAEGMATLAAEALQRGDPIRGAVAFHTAYLTCTKCHAADEGLSPLGPNLTAPPVGAAGPLTGNALTAHLVESLLAPSQIIRPDYRTTTILKSDGQSISGIISRESPQGVVLRDALANGRETEIVASEIDERSTSSVSICWQIGSNFWIWCVISTRLPEAGRNGRRLYYPLRHCWLRQCLPLTNARSIMQA